MEDKKIDRITVFFQIAPSIIITVLLFIILFFYVSLEETLKALSEIQPLLVLFSCSMLFLIYFFRSLQLYIFFSKKIPASFLCLMTTIHTLFIQLIPFRLGELSFIYLIGKTKKVTNTDALVVLGSARMFDIIVVSIFFVFSFFFLKKIPFPFSSPWLYLPILIILFLIITLFFFLKQSLSYIHRYLYNSSHLLILRLIEKLENILLFLQTFQHKKALIKIFILSLFIWTTYYSMLFILYRSMNVSLPIETFIFIISAANLFAIIPIQGIAGFGNVEFSVAFLLALFGIEKIYALKTAFIVHVISLVGILSLGIFGIFLWIYLFQRNDK